MIDVALSWDEGEMKDALVYTIANHMKKCYLNWNKDTVEDGVIFNHLYDLSDGKIDLRNAEEELADTKSLLKKRGGQGQNNSRGKKHSKRKR